MTVKPQYLCAWCDGDTTYDEPFCPHCQRTLSVQVLHRRSQQVGQVKVNFTVGRIVSRKGK